jgi:hypothetical protein
MWSDVGLDEVNCDFIAATFGHMIENAGDVSYGLDSDLICFDEDGTYRAPPAGKGLTCATFIVAVMKSQGYEICDLPTWGHREEDQAWQEWIIRMMEKYHVDPAHIDLVRNDIGAKRYKPDEVVASASLMSDAWPIKFSDARALADEITAELNAMQNSAASCDAVSAASHEANAGPSVQD